MIQHIWILGGDLRCHWLARGLAEDGYTVHAYGLDPTLLGEHTNLISQETLQGAPEGDCVFFPLPICTKDGNLFAPYHPTPLPFSPLLGDINPNSLVVGGKVTPFLHSLAEEKGISITDYFTREELTIANAVPTAEGCLQLAMERLPTTLQNATILILGYGRVAKATAKRFSALGAHVTVSARSYSALADAESEGFTPLPLHQLPNEFRDVSCVVNTIPSQVIRQPQLLALPDSTPIIDLASSPGGVDLVTAEELHRTVIPALSLPGKVAPKTAGDILKKNLYLIFQEHQENQERTAIF